MKRTYYCDSCSTHYDEDHGVCPDPLCEGARLVCGLCLGKGEKKWSWRGVEGDADCICQQEAVAP